MTFFDCSNLQKKYKASRSNKQEFGRDQSAVNGNVQFVCSKRLSIVHTPFEQNEQRPELHIQAH
jgi:hypothetical protein